MAAKSDSRDHQSRREREKERGRGGGGGREEGEGGREEGREGRMEGVSDGGREFTWSNLCSGLCHLILTRQYNYYSECRFSASRTIVIISIIEGSRTRVV